MDLGLKNKLVIVTGGARGIGHATVERFRAEGATAISWDIGETPAVDVTSPDVAELGLVVTKVVAPELCALDVVHGARFLGGRRLYEAAAALGLRAGVVDGDDINPDPHPFP